MELTNLEKKVICFLALTIPPLASFITGLIPKYMGIAPNDFIWQNRDTFFYGGIGGFYSILLLGATVAYIHNQNTKI